LKIDFGAAYTFEETFLLKQTLLAIKLKLGKQGSLLVDHHLCVVDLPLLLN
jgi:hypothetical protein